MTRPAFDNDGGSHPVSSVPAGADENDPAAIEAALQGSRKWPSGLEALFERRSGAARRAEIAWVIVLMGIVNLACGGVDALDGPAVFWKGLPWRIFVLALALVCAAWQRKCAPASRLGRAAELALTIAPPVAIMVVSEFIAEYTGRLADRYMVAAAFGVASFVVVAPLKLATARWLCAVAIAFYPIVPWLLPHDVKLAANLDMPLFTTAVMATSLEVARRNEHARRAAFLLRRRHEIAAAELNAMNAELLRMATVDALTGLQNRRAFNQALQVHWQDRRQTIGLAIFDVDWFKAFNDSAGHAAGDAALQAVAGAAERAIRCGTDLAARIGGEEFAVIMPGVDPDQAFALGERLRAEISALDLPHPGRPGHALSISVGVACCTHADRRGQNSALFMIEADTALYAAKAGGRNCVVMAGPSARMSVA
jgi:diguanylate cyclase (GGDEF)-like protein